MTPAERSRKWRLDNPEKSKALVREFTERRSAKGPGHRRAEGLKRQYGMTLETFSALLDSQGGVCALCGRVPPEGKVTNWHVDHDHACCSGGPTRTCGQCVRGVLCAKCNVGLGQFNDDPELLQRAINYLTSQVG